MHSISIDIADLNHKALTSICPCHDIVAGGSTRHNLSVTRPLITKSTQTIVISHRAGVRAQGLTNTCITRNRHITCRRIVGVGHFQCESAGDHAKVAVIRCHLNAEGADLVVVRCAAERLCARIKTQPRGQSRTAGQLGRIAEYIARIHIRKSAGWHREAEDCVFGRGLRSNRRHDRGRIVGVGHFQCESAGDHAKVAIVRCHLNAEGADLVVAPGPIRTDMFYDVVDEGSEKEKAIAAGIPVKRLGESVDVARAVRFFAEPDNSFVTGQVLYVCGGTSVGSLTL